jgi:hypothetical protein
MARKRKSRWEGLIGLTILLGATGLFGGVCFAVLRTLTSLSLWVEIPISLLVGVLGLVAIFFMPSLFGDEAASLQWSSPVLGGSRQKKVPEKSPDEQTRS